MTKVNIRPMNMKFYIVVETDGNEILDIFPGGTCYTKKEAEDIIEEYSESQPNHGCKVIEVLYRGNLYY